MEPVDLNFLKTLAHGKYRENFPQMVRAYLREKVSDLPSTELTIIYLYFWENYTLTEISEKLKIKYSKVEIIYEYALSRLKKKITDDYIEDIASIPAQFDGGF